MPIGLVGEEFVESLESPGGLALIPLDPFGHEVEDLDFEMGWTSLRITSAAHESRFFEDLEMLRHRLHGHGVRSSKVDQGRV
jgi:hypothetical protein